MENNNKFAILTDTGSDLSVEVAEKLGIYLIPLYIHYKDKSYKDRYELDPKIVYERFEEEVPSTSTPSIGDISLVYDKIKEDGYKDLIVISISSGLSGAYNAFNLAKNDYEGLNIRVIDSKNIAIATGFLALYANVLRERGLSFEETVKILEENIDKSKVLFTLDTLKYLIQGGRIGRVSGTIGSLLNIKPIISCDDDGIYYNVDKVRGRKKSIIRLAEIAKEYAREAKNYYICLCNGGANDSDYQLFKDELAEAIKNSQMSMDIDITASLVVHTGPGLIGIGIFIED